MPGDGEVPAGGPSLPSQSPSLGRGCNRKIQGEADEQSCTGFSFGLAQVTLLMWFTYFFFVLESSKNLSAKYLDHSSIQTKVK